MKLSTDPRFIETLQSFPDEVQGKMEVLRELVHEIAQEEELVTELEETLRWGEPTFISNVGTSLRMGWSDKRPDQYGLFVQCSSLVIPTIRAVHADALRYDKNRGVLFQNEEDLPLDLLRPMIHAALVYKKVKKLPMLGIV